MLPRTSVVGVARPWSGRPQNRQVRIAQQLPEHHGESVEAGESIVAEDPIVDVRPAGGEHAGGDDVADRHRCHRQLVGAGDGGPVDVDHPLIGEPRALQRDSDRERGPRRIHGRNRSPSPRQQRHQRNRNEQCRHPLPRHQVERDRDRECNAGPADRTSRSPARERRRARRPAPPDGRARRRRVSEPISHVTPTSANHMREARAPGATPPATTNAEPDRHVRDDLPAGHSRVSRCRHGPRPRRAPRPRSRRRPPATLRALASRPRPNATRPIANTYPSRNREVNGWPTSVPSVSMANSTAATPRIGMCFPRELPGRPGGRVRRPRWSPGAPTSCG